MTHADRCFLWSAGKLLSKYSDRLMSLVADTLSAMKDLQDVKTGQMFIGAGQTTGVYILPRLIRESDPIVLAATTFQSSVVDLVLYQRPLLPQGQLTSCGR